MFFSKHRRRRSSTTQLDHTPRQNGVVDKSTSSHRSFRLKSPGLPTHYQSPSSVTCNSFLLGGSYYPGKDKARIHLRRRTFWHRWFCSTPTRKFLSILICSYVVLWHVIVPGTAYLLKYGKILAGQQPSISDSNSKFLSTEQRKRFVQHVLDGREEMLYGVEQKVKQRLKLYKDILPQWYQIYHGQDSNGRGASLNSGARPPETSKKHQDPNETESKAEAAENEKSRNQANNDRHDSPKVGRHSLQEERPARDARTLQNMESLPITSSCPSNLPPSQINTTLIVQSSFDRLWIIEETCLRWKDPIVAVVYLRLEDKPAMESTVLKAYQDQCPHLTIVIEITSQNMSEYPVNMLRNMGLDAVETSHILVADIDFVPSNNLEDTIRDTIKNFHEPLQQGATALVVPAFERVPPKPCDEVGVDCATFLKNDKSFIPSTFEALRDCVQKKECSVFQQFVNWEGHFSTHSESWLKQNWFEEDHDGLAPSTRIRTIKCLDSLRYEPYVVLRWCPASAPEAPVAPVAPYYDERFYGYGKNKIELISHLRFMGYRFGILPRGFIVHNPHQESTAKKIWNNAGEFDLHSKMDQLYPKFLQELWDKYRDRKNDVLMPCPQQLKKKKMQGNAQH